MSRAEAPRPARPLPHGPRLWVAIAAAIALVLAAGLWWTQMIDGLRKSASLTLAEALRAQQLELALERASADELLMLHYPDSAVARDARDALALDRARAGALAAEIASLPPTAFPDGPGTPDDAARLEAEVAPILARLDRDLAGPATPPPAAPLATLLGGPRALVRAIADRSLADRRLGVRRITTREHAALWLAVIGTSLLLVLSGVTGSRLIASRARVRSARRRAALQAERLAAAVAAMGDGVALFDAADRMFLCNPRLLALAGLGADAALAGETYASLRARLAGRGADPSGPAPPMPGRPSSAQIRLEGRSLVLTRSLMPDGGQVLLAYDITRQVEDEAALAHAQKMNLLGRLTGGVAHDFNNLLQALSLDLEAVAAALDPPGPAAAAPPEAREGVASALASVGRGMRLTRHLLAYSRRQDPVAESIDAAALLARQAELLRRTLGDPVQVECSTAPGLWPVLAEAGLLENAILNLAVNARDAMPAGGRLRLAAENLEGAPARVRITVSDAGIGMTAEQVARATEPFFTTKEAGRGTGLGLAMVRRFAEMSGGAFRLESAPGRGTDAILELPRGRALASVPVPPLPPPARGRGELVLLVEDDEQVRLAARRSIEALGYRVAAAADADEAVRMLGTEGVRPALLMTDVSMPGRLDAGALASWARRERPGLPVLFNTGDLESPVLAAIAPGPLDAVLAKPWRLDELARQLRRLLDAAGIAAGGREAG